MAVTHSPSGFRFPSSPVPSIRSLPVLSPKLHRKAPKSPAISLRSPKSPALSLRSPKSSPAVTPKPQRKSDPVEISQALRMRFADHFWNEQLEHFSGFATLSQRLKDGKHFSRDYVDFLKQRAQLEESYGKALIKISRGSGGKDEIGSLRKAWETLRQETECIGQERICLASHLLEEAVKVQDASEAHRQRRKQVEEQVHRLQHARKAAHRKLLELRGTYTTKSHQAELLGQALLVDMGKATIHPKEIEKLKQKHSRCLVMVDQADAAYKAIVDALEDLRLAWETETIVACDLFQELEEKRIQTLRNSIWMVANHHSKICCTEDDNYEAVRKSLEECNHEEDIELFITERKTGQPKPAPIPYIPYKSDGVSMEITPTAIEFPDGLTNGKAKFINNNEQNNNGIHIELSDKVDDLFPWRVIADYKAQSDHELSVLADEYVRVTNKTHRDWWQVLTEDGQTGYCPAEYLRYGAHVDSV